jgi:integrase
MAALELRNKTFRVVFRYGGRKYAYSLDTGDLQTAEALLGGVEKTLMLIEQRAIRVPDGVDIIAFVKGDGKVEEPPKPAPAPLTFAQFKERYLQAHNQGAMEANSLSTVTMHLSHFERTLGARFAIRGLTLLDLQHHVNARLKKRYRGKPLSPVTVKKEVSSFRAAWNWAVVSDLVSGPFPSRGLVYPKTDEKPPFMSLEEVRRRIAPNLTVAEQDDLWECLYLTTNELPCLLAYIQKTALHPWVYPLLAFIAHTGARRSEALRVLVQDVDFTAKTVLVREKKRSRKQRTTRRVPLTPFLAEVLTEWLRIHPGGPSLFCHAGEVPRSKKRSRTTGHKGTKARPTSSKGRMAAVSNRQRPALGPLTGAEVHDHFRRTLAGSEWEILPGLHCLRHSFISACASLGVDQRLIDEWVGHQSEEQRRRYRHLYPGVQQQAIARVFG